MVRPAGQTEERGASYAAPSPAAPGPAQLSCPYVSLFVPANPQRAQTSCRHTGRSRVCLHMPQPLLRTPHPDQLLWVAIVTPAVSGQTLSKTSKTTFLLFFQKKRIYGIYILQMVIGKKLFVFANFAILPAQAPCRYWVYLGCEEWSRSL